MNTKWILILPVLFALSTANAITDLTLKSEQAATVLKKSSLIPESAIPASLLKNATCVATFPNVLRAGFIFGARFGKGLVSCRTGQSWSLPSFIQLRGGSWGFQYGLEAIDLILVFVRSNAVEKFSKDNFTMGADATLAVGPLGRDAQIGTDYKLNSEIYSYSKARGLYIGLTLQGTALLVDEKDNSSVYGNASALSLLTSDGSHSPPQVLQYYESLESITN